MKIPDNLIYSRDHEWIKINTNECIIGITEYAQGELGDIVFMELPDIGLKVSKGESVAVIEAVKTVADLFAPISGEIIKINENLVDNPELINSDPYGEGWIVKIYSETQINASDYLNADQYLVHIGH